MIQEKQKLSGILNSKQFLNGTLSNSVIYIDPITQEKEVTPTRNIQEITPDTGYTGLSKVTVKGYVPKVANKTITSNGVYSAEEEGLDGYDIVKVETGKYAPRYVSFQQYTGTELDYEIANLDTSNVTSMAYMFYQCSKLTTLDLSNFNTSNVTNMNSMFLGCKSLTTLDLTSFNTSNVTSMSYVFNNCLSLTTLKLTNFDTSKVTTFYQTFYRCNKIVSIPKLNASSVTSMSYMFDNCYSLTTLGGLENLGQAYLTTSYANNSSYKLDLSYCTLLTEQSLINVLTNLYDIKTKGCKTQQVVLGSTNLAKLTSTEGQQALSNAQAKGWTVS